MIDKASFVSVLALEINTISASQLNLLAESKFIVLNENLIIFSFSLKNLALNVHIELLQELVYVI